MSTIPVRLPSCNGPKKWWGPRFTDCRAGGMGHVFPHDEQGTKDVIKSRNRMLAADRWARYERNDFSNKPRSLHLPIHRKALNSLGYLVFLQFSSVAQSCLTLYNPMLHTRLPCPPPTPGACPNSCPSSQWRHPTISSCLVPFSSCLQSFPVSGSFPSNQSFTSGDQGTRASASASVLPMNIFRTDFL